MSNRLLVNPGTPQAWEIQLKPGLNRIGRGEDNDFAITHPSVSTHHCEITVTGTGISLRDLGSTNGTFVNRSPIKETKLASGQHVQFGAVDMIFESSTATAAPASAPAPAPAATGVSAPPPPPPPPPAPMGAGLRINRDAPPAHSTQSTPTAAPTSAPPPPGIRAAPTVSNFQPAAAIADDDGKKPNFALSLTGVFLGAILGAVVWHIIYRYTDRNWGIMALGIGVLAGVAPQLLGHYRSKLMGFLAASIALVAILTTQYFNTRFLYEAIDKENVTDYYESELADAKKAVAAIPEGTETEIRAFIAKEESFAEFKVKPEEVEAESVEELKKRLPVYRELAAGKITPEQLYQREVKDTEDEVGGTIEKVFFIVSALGVFNIVNIFLGVGAAFMTAKGDS